MSERARGSGGWWVAVAVALLLLNLGLILQDRWTRPAPVRAREVTPRGGFGAEEQRTIEVFQRSSPSVVHITTLREQRDVFSLNVRRIPAGTGTGFLWDEAGHVVTNFHVIRDADVAQVTLADQTTYEAERVGIAPDKDLAVLRLIGLDREVSALPLGTSHDLVVGQRVFAIGNPFGLDQTLTTGIISAVGREIESVTRLPIKGVIQTDAAINPGNSGGPLLDSAGRIIGVNTAIYSPSGTSAGIGFAIPVDTVLRVVPDLITHGKVLRPSLGVQVADDQLARRLGLPGVLVLEVIAGSGAARVGVQPTRRNERGRWVLGDVIVGVDGEPVRGIKDLYVALDEHEVGDVVEVQVQRAGATLSLQIPLHELN